VALDRARVGSVSNKDDSAHIYTVDVGATAKASEHHWYTPALSILGFGEDEKKEQHKVTVRVADDAGVGARVSVAGDGTDQASAGWGRRCATTWRARRRPPRSRRRPHLLLRRLPATHRRLQLRRRQRRRPSRA